VIFPDNDRARELILTVKQDPGLRKHDDLADAFSLLMLKILEDDHGGFDFFFVGGYPEEDYGPFFL